MKLILASIFFFFSFKVYSQNNLFISNAEASIIVSIQSPSKRAWKVLGDMALHKEGDLFSRPSLARQVDGNDADPLSNAIENYQEPKVKLAGFHAKKEQAKVLVDWVTIHDPEVDIYYLQRKNGQDDWETIFEALPTGSSEALKEFEFSDGSAKPGSNFYRILQKDKQGKTHASDPLVVDSFQGGYHVTHIYPVPIIFGTSIYLHIERATKVNIVLYDMKNRPIGRVFAGEATPGDHRIELDMDRVPNGKYRCVIEAANSVSFREIIK